jgi:putative salt-induced outer membrane protein YdiY
VPGESAFHASAVRRSGAAGLPTPLFALLGLCVLAGPLSAKVAPPSFAPPRALVEAEDLAPREPGFSGPDWIQLVSGEWLQGSVDRIRNDSLEFDSDELDSLKFDIDDVYAVVTAGPHTLSLEKRQIVTGEVIVRGFEVRVRTADGIESFTRPEIVGMVPGTPSESNYWSGKISVGLSLQKGNTDTSELTGLADVTRETAVTRTNAKYNGSIGTVSGTTTANNHRATAQGDIFVTRRFYVTVAYFEYFTDEFQNVDLRLTPAAGVGYDVVDRSRIQVTTTLAVGAQYTRNVTPPQFSTDRDRVTASIIAGLEFETDLTERVEWDGEYRLQLGVPDTSETNHHALTTVSIDVWADLDFDVTFVWDRNQSPGFRQDATAPGGFSQPVKNDYRLSAGIGWDF